MLGGGVLRCTGGSLHGRKWFQPAGAHEHTLCTQPPSDGAVTEATDEVGCPATDPASPSLQWPILPSRL